jgi:MFS family permease
LTRRDRVAVSIAFLAFGAAVGNLIPRLPALKDHLALSDGQVGLTLVIYSLGAVTGAAASRFVFARGSRLYVRAAAVALAAAIVTPGLATSLATLVASFYVVGVCAGLIDVLVNGQGAELERLAGRPLINGFHAFWSMGAVLGSAAAGLAAYLGVSPLIQFAVAGVVIAAGSAPFLRWLPDTRSGAERAPPAGAAPTWLSGMVVAVATMTFAAIIVEGGTSDWSALYLRELSHAEPAVAALGFGGFSLAAMLVRFRADILTAHTSPATVMRAGAATAGAGLTLAIAVPALPGAITGFALVGMGCAVQLPLAFAAGANLGRSGAPLAIVIGSAYVGAIVSPALIGAAADHFGLRVAMTVPLIAALVVLSLAGNLGRRSDVAATPAPARR